MWAQLAGSILGAGANILGGKHSAKLARDSAREKMAFQREMSDTAHQRQVKDLRAAGLNPILSANSGASMASGAMAPMPDFSALGSQMVSSGTDTARTASQTKTQAQERENMRMQKEMMRTQQDILRNQNIGVLFENRIKQTAAWSAENLLREKSSNPKLWGKIDAWAPIIGQAVGTAKDAGILYRALTGFGGGLSHSTPYKEPIGYKP